MKKTLLRVCLLLVVVSLAAMPLMARGKKKSQTDPGKYTDWMDEIDEIEIIEPFQLSSYEKVVIAPFDSDGLELPEKSDNAYKPVVNVLADTSDDFVDGVHDGELKGIRVEAGEDAGANELLVRGRVTTMDPGSRAARYFAGFGAGAARTQVEVEIVDGGTNTVLAKFTQERRSGVGAAGGDYEDLLNRNLRAIGEDLALILGAFR